MSWIAFISGASMKGPFLTERAILFCLPLHNELVGSLVIARLITQCGLAPGGHGVIPLHSAFTSAMGVIHRIHHHAANRRPNSAMPRPSGFTYRHVFVIEIAYLA